MKSTTLWNVLFLALLQSAAASSASAQTERLIEYQDSLGQIKRDWLNETQIQELSQEQHRLGKCPGFMDITDQPEPLPGTEPGSSLMDFENFLHSQRLQQRNPQQQRLLALMLPQVSLARMEATVRHLSSYRNRFYRSQTGSDAAQWLRSQFTSIAAGRSDISVDFWTHANFTQPSIIVTIQGTGALASEIVVLGGHMDSIAGFIPTNPLAPGADDNASGISSVLEVFRVIVESGYRPERTLQFFAYAGEEAGLLGSQAIANQYRQNNLNVVSAVQLDMTMFPGPQPEISLVTDFVNSELTDFMKILIDTYIHIPWSTTQCGYACSDHASWTRAGYPSAFPFETVFDQYNRNIHTARDTIDILNIQWGGHFTGLALAYVMEMSADRPQ